MKFHTGLQIGMILSVVATPIANAGTLGLRKLKPSWTESTVRLQPNASFLGNTSMGRGKESLPDPWLGPGSDVRLRQQYDDLVRDYESRRSYRLNSAQDEKTHLERVRGFSRGVVQAVQQRQIQSGLIQARAVVEANETLSQLTAPMGVLATGVAAFYGTPMVLKLDDEASMTARAHVPNQEGSFALNSPFLNSAVEFHMAPWSPEEERRQRALDPTRRQERVRVGIGRNLPVWGLYSGISYGRSSGLVTTSVSKQLSDHLSASWDSSRPVQSASNREDSLKFLYGIRF